MGGFLTIVFSKYLMENLLVLFMITTMSEKASIYLISEIDSLIFADHLLVGRIHVHYFCYIFTI